MAPFKTKHVLYFPSNLNEISSLVEIKDLSTSSTTLELFSGYNFADFGVQTYAGVSR